MAMSVRRTSPPSLLGRMDKRNLIQIWQTNEKNWYTVDSSRNPANPNELRLVVYLTPRYPKHWKWQRRHGRQQAVLRGDNRVAGYVISSCHPELLVITAMLVISCVCRRWAWFIRGIKKLPCWWVLLEKQKYPERNGRLCEVLNIIFPKNTGGLIWIDITLETKTCTKHIDFWTVSQMSVSCAPIAMYRPHHGRSNASRASTGFESSEKRSQFTSKNGYSDDFGLAPCQVNSGKWRYYRNPLPNVIRIENFAPIFSEFGSISIPPGIAWLIISRGSKVWNDMKDNLYYCWWLKSCTSWGW